MKRSGENGGGGLEPKDLAEFSAAVEIAQGAAVAWHETRYRKADDWQASRSYLKVHRPEIYSDHRPISKKELKKLERDAAGSGTDLEVELSFARKRLAMIRGLILRGGSDATPLDKLLALEAGALNVLGRLARLQKELNPGKEKSGDLRVMLELTAGAGALEQGERAPNLELDAGAAPLEAPAPKMPVEPAAPVGGTGDPEWDDVTE